MYNGYKFAIVEDSIDFAIVVDAVLNESDDLKVSNPDPAKDEFLPPLMEYYREVSKFEDKGYDLVFADLRLRETWGPETVLKLREKTSAPIIVLTGLGGGMMTATDMQLFLEAGANQVCTKEAINDKNFPVMVKQIADEYHNANSKN